MTKVIRILYIDGDVAGFVSFHDVDTLDVSATSGLIDLTLGDGTGGSLNLAGIEEIALGAQGDSVHFTANDVFDNNELLIDGGAGEWQMAA